MKRLMYFMRNRFVIFGGFCLLFVLAQYIAFGTLLPSTDTKDLWFYSGIFMVLFSLLFIEPYYTSPKNVITNAIPLLLVFIAIKPSITFVQGWWGAVMTLITLLFASIGSLAIEDKEKSPDHWKNRASGRIKDLVVLIGQGKVLYSAVFIYFLLSSYSIQDPFTLTFFIIWFFILAINPKSIHGTFAAAKAKGNKEEIGEIFGVQSKKIFLAKLYEDRRSIKKFDVVRFRYSMQDASDLIITGIVFDTYLLNQEKWAKLLQLGEPRKSDGPLEKNVVYKISNKTDIESLLKELKIDDLVGVVIDGSTIGKIKFESLPSG